MNFKCETHAQSFKCSEKFSPKKWHFLPFFNIKGLKNKFCVAGAPKTYDFLRDNLIQGQKIIKVTS